jgi:hypothetical protein
MSFFGGGSPSSPAALPSIIAPDIAAVATNPALAPWNASARRMTHRLMHVARHPADPDGHRSFKERRAVSKEDKRRC